MKHFLNDLKIENEQKAEEYRKKNILERNLKQLNIPARFKKELVFIDQEQKKIFEKIVSYFNTFKINLEEGRNLFFIGKMGTGKTFFSYWLAEKIIYSGYRARVITFDDFIDEIRGTWKPGSLLGENQVMKYYQNLDFLVLDEVGVHDATESEQKTIYTLLNFRYNHKKPTLFTANRALSEFKNVLGERAANKILENSFKPFLFLWKSLRE